MEAQFGGKSRHLYGPALPELKALGKKSMEWDLNDWKWDGDLFAATPINPLPADCRSRQLFPLGSGNPTLTGLSNSSSSSDEITLGNEKGKRELEKRRRDMVIVEEELNDEAGSLNLKLGGQVYPITDAEIEKLGGKNAKKSKIFPAVMNRAVCQVDYCRADLSDAKDYHRRHKVCDMHSKASRALVGNVMQRFCQQCSRFHVLQEFDEGKRSCRRRLAGHNRRRRKTHPENIVNGGSLNDGHGSGYLLISLLRILSNIHANNSEEMKDQDLLSHLLRNLASLAGTINKRNMPSLLSGSQDLQQIGTSGDPVKEPLRPAGECGDLSASRKAEERTSTAEATPYCTNNGIPPRIRMLDTSGGQTGLNNIDLNNAYDDSENCEENLETSFAPIGIVGTGSLECSPWGHRASNKSSPPQPSRNSGSTSSQSPSSSSGEAQSRTDRIVFKLFGKDPSNFPLALRKQILDWLSNSPTDIESYIRPGCIILTIYLRLGKSKWEEVSGDLSSSLLKLLDASNDSFWRLGWVYTRVQHHMAFVYNGQVVLDTPLPFRSHNHCSILSIKPIAVSLSERAHFLVKGFNLSRSTLRLLCALEGQYMVEENCSDAMVEGDEFMGSDEIQCISFSCSMPNVTGRGFIEVEDHGLSSSFFPFIVAEKDVCSEICMLESAIEVASTVDGIHGERTEAKDQALDFIHEMGWLLHKNNSRHRLGNMVPNLEPFPFKRFRWLMEFSIERDWCAVVKKLLEILCKGCVDAGEHSSMELAVWEMALLHRAVRRNCRGMVVFLLQYVPDGILDKSGCEQKQRVNRASSSFLFRPDTIGPGGLTPLHVAASRSGSESVLDALTDDPGLVGTEAWKVARDSTGLTPNDYACLRGYYSYIHLVQKKINKKPAGTGHHVALDIPPTVPDYNVKPKLTDGFKSAKVSSFDTEKDGTKQPPIQRQLHCKICERRTMAHGNVMQTSLSLYRPAMLAMVAIAAVCVCVALFFKSSPEVLYVFRPFRWELLKYGSS